MLATERRSSATALLPQDLRGSRCTRPLVSLDPRTPHFGSKAEDADAWSSCGTESTADSTDGASTGSACSGDELWAQAPGARAGAEETPGLPSAGSVLHGLGECEPCAWFWKPQGCLHGQSCYRCHLCPMGEIKVRKAAKLSSRRAITRRELKGQSELSEDHFLGLGAGNRRGELGPLELREAPPPGAAAAARAPPAPAPEPRRAAAEDSLPLPPLSPAYLRPAAQLRPPPGLQHPHSEAGLQTAGTCPLVPLGAVAGSAPVPEGPAAELELELLLRRPQLSAGSAQHGLGLCEPCAWFWKPQGCQNGPSCSRCHACPKGEVKARKAKKKAAMRFINSALP